MIVLAVILLVAGLLFDIPILLGVGACLVVVGAVLALLGVVGQPVCGRIHYF